MPTGLLIYDGDCGFCTRAARWFDDHSGDSGAISPWQSLDLNHLGLTEAQVSTAVFWSEAGLTYTGIDALNEALRRCGRGWAMLVAVTSKPPIIWLSRWIYPISAKYRHKFPSAPAERRSDDRDELVIDLRDQPASSEHNCSDVDTSNGFRASDQSRARQSRRATSK